MTKKNIVPLICTLFITSMKAEFFGSRLGEPTKYAGEQITAVGDTAARTYHEATTPRDYNNPQLNRQVYYNNPVEIQTGEVVAQRRYNNGNGRWYNHNRLTTGMTGTEQEHYYNTTNPTSSTTSSRLHGSMYHDTAVK